MRTTLITLVPALVIAALSLGTPTARALEPETCVRIMAQDSTLNNLVDPPGYQTAPLGKLGRVVRAGNGTRSMVLIPGLGFGGDVFDEFIEGFIGTYDMRAVTLPGFDGTAAPPAPNDAPSFSEQTWTNASLDAIENLIKEEGMHHVVLVGHWLTGTQLALRLAIKHPENVRAVVILAGATRMMVTDPQYEPYYATLPRRVNSVDTFLAPRWFKTVTRETWDDNNFLPGDYAVNPVRGLRLWREAADVPLHVWVRYLCEFNAQDISLDLAKLTVPALILAPGLDGIWYEHDQDYMFALCHRSWEGHLENNPNITMVTIPGSRACLWFDQPEAVNKAVVDFLKGLPDP